ncbi:MAG: hypothetical protein A2921_03780 [Candidatus Magasanikbacteria bacterium RIFCSPLOWO2_01_FULL_43_20b]|uniref:Uncharacterized protein n=1 Tax=Candidatus Magasanikbacteria bacterium RIFCSPLOWO2_12_FULL_43_12 TaxID=1798692 RepID=A0A1F6MR17_9BACT|nr:MAG: hypothetical protein A3C74_00085 [Candidatus Magasanikbacteria bacterium RIFCSPHIGHO2_02_FULL_44_13]OGH72521.1 MAG: hypothetical protein A3I93_04370 [Candidatus Magasanikbacteria bacterium RIFCSPLOWO2_02_FULL_43_22]OGH73692.1 MAG: hypothetical protein A2921_03780 [Candidatus Magasanikbacteria bacterium RIFCSPLOWO2_01_FULL_43_20b]OGH74106.1 MAG: hypothetical protein A3G00_05040 [Candidatus Magasanikbacteria bacterium RIFCSPLOWO2_12_FULL_43_12]
MSLNGARFQRCSASRSRELATSPNNASPVRSAHPNFAQSENCGFRPRQNFGEARPVMRNKFFSA